MSKRLNSFVTVLAMVTASGTLGCGAAQIAEKSLIDCVAADHVKIDALIADLGTKRKPDGSHDWAAIEADAIASGMVIGGCALAQFVESYLAPSPTVKAPPDGLTARQTFEHFRATQARGATFKTSLGAL